MDDSAHNSDALLDRLVALLNHGDSMAILQLCDGAADLTAASHFIAAVAAYREGFIPHTVLHLQAAVSRAMRWEEDDAMDAIIRPLLRGEEYFDFEQLYLDALDGVEDQKRPQNRWFSLNMPVYEILATADAQERGEKSARLMRLLVPDRAGDFMRNGGDALQNILRDLSRSETDARFGLEAMKSYREKDHRRLAGLILGLLLENLKEFAPYFSLSIDLIDGSSLQQLASLLPQQMAIDLLLLYALSEPVDRMGPAPSLDWENTPLFGLMTAAFVNFYQQVHQYRMNVKAPPAVWQD